MYDCVKSDALVRVKYALSSFLFTVSAAAPRTTRPASLQSLSLSARAEWRPAPNAVAARTAAGPRGAPRGAAAAVAPASVRMARQRRHRDRQSCELQY